MQKSDTSLGCLRCGKREFYIWLPNQRPQRVLYVVVGGGLDRDTLHDPGFMAHILPTEHGMDLTTKISNSESALAVQGLWHEQGGVVCWWCGGQMWRAGRGTECYTLMGTWRSW